MNSVITSSITALKLTMKAIYFLEDDTIIDVMESLSRMHFIVHLPGYRLYLRGRSGWTDSIYVVLTRVFVIERDLVVII